MKRTPYLVTLGTILPRQCRRVPQVRHTLHHPFAPRQLPEFIATLPWQA